MSKFLQCFTILAFTLVLWGCQGEGSSPPEEPKGADNMAYRWGHIALESTALDTERFRPRPTITSRYLGLIFTSVFDAWSRYDEKAIPVMLKAERRPTAEQTLRNKEIAISYAALRTMNEYYFTDSLLWKSHMREMGFDPDDFSLDPSTPQGIGNLAAKAVIEGRKNDGSNQYGQQAGSNGRPYFDYVNYQPINSPNINIDPNRWQPKYFADEYGGRYAPECLTPYWDLVDPITLDSASQFRPGPPPMMGSKQLEKEVKEVITLQANLTDQEKALIEFMRDGPQSVQQAGHWLKFAQEVSIRDEHTLDEDVKMYFLNQITAMDAFIASWDSKMYYDFARPYALVHEYFKEQRIMAWGGPGKGVIEIPGTDWKPYSPETFLCPPFPSYVSGHSCVSGACGEALRLFKGSDEFGSSVTLVAGALTEPNHLGDTVKIEFPTFTEAANMAGKSRVLGGYHIEADNVAGLALGRQVAKNAYEFYLEHIGQE